MNNLYITSAWLELSTDELEKQPLAGSLFVIENCGSCGLVADIFRGR